MRHSFIDKYSDRDSIVHRLDPRAKIASFLMYVLAVVLTPALAPAQAAGYVAVILCVILCARIPAAHVFSRSLIVVPFAFMTAALAFAGGRPAGHSTAAVAAVCAKAWLSAAAAVVLSSTTRFSNLIKGLERLGAPAVIVLLMSFMYRYLFVLLDEAMRMDRARSARCSGGRPWRQLRAAGNIVGALFVRTYERGERVYQSMVARGFGGEMHTLDVLRFSRRDATALALFCCLVAAVRFWGAR